MKESEFIWMNGKLVKWHDAKVHILTHALHYGTGVFEGIRCYHTRKGPALFRLKDHIKRLLNSAHIMQFKTNFTHKEYEDACKELVRVNKFKECYLRPLIYLGYGKMGITTTDCPVDSAITPWVWDTYLGEDGQKNGIRAKVCSFSRHSPNAMMTKAKATGNYTNSALAKMDALNAGYQEAILLDIFGNVAECSVENIFIVRNGVLITPPTTNTLEGLTRDSIMQIARDMKIKVREETFTKDQLY
ncbi:MAG TPA: branched-chain amino acid transaminase, partial [archaeon]|nr:branched-chain amino acid transaminase [archaeon]